MPGPAQTAWYVFDQPGMWAWSRRRYGRTFTARLPVLAARGEKQSQDVGAIVERRIAARTGDVLIEQLVHPVKPRICRSRREVPPRASIEACG